MEDLQPQIANCSACYGEYQEGRTRAAPPDGAAIIMLSEDQTEATMGAISGLAEVVILVRDRERSLQFYRDVLGLKVISPAGLPGVFLQVGDDRAGVPFQVVLVPRPASAPPVPPKSQGNLHHIGLEIPLAALASEKERLEGLGLEVRTGSHPFLPVEAIYVDDPDGNEIELVAHK